ncbi:MAG: formylglycine-generating enzyme family protein [Nannocystaceae bacterium]
MCPNSAERDGPRREDLVLVEAGCFPMGCDPGLGDSEQPRCKSDSPLHTVHLDPYIISKFEVTVEQYAKCVAEEKCTLPNGGDQGFINPYCNWWHTGRDNHPINCISRAQAAKYCEWENMRLPTEAEWEKAARGSDQRIYPWGNDDTCDNAVICKFNMTKPISSQKTSLDSSHYGVLGMGGNVGEWVHDMYIEDFYEVSTEENPLKNPMAPGPQQTRDSVLFRGGSFQDASPLPTYNRFVGVSTYVRDHTIGVRCAGDVP